MDCQSRVLHVFGFGMTDWHWDLLDLLETSPSEIREKDSTAGFSLWPTGIRKRDHVDLLKHLL